MEKKLIVTRPVYAYNAIQESELIRRFLPDYPNVAFDTEFPGTVFAPDRRRQYSTLSAEDRYSYVKANVDALKPIQVGLTLFDELGRLPSLGNKQCVWEFNLSDFDICKDTCSPESVRLLISQGIDFRRNKLGGIHSHWLVHLMAVSGLLRNGCVNWVTFHGAYDFAYLIKALLKGRPLPNTMTEFLYLVRTFFGNKIFDVKYMAKRCNGLFGGLEKVAGKLAVERAVGKCHQAGSDSFVTAQVFLKMRELHFTRDGGEQHAGVICGLQSC